MGEERLGDKDDSNETTEKDPLSMPLTQRCNGLGRENNNIDRERDIVMQLINIKLEIIDLMIDYTMHTSPKSQMNHLKQVISRRPEVDALLDQLANVKKMNSKKR